MTKMFFWTPSTGLLAQASLPAAPFRKHCISRRPAAVAVVAAAAALWPPWHHLPRLLGRQADTQDGRQSRCNSRVAAHGRERCFCRCAGRHTPTPQDIRTGHSRGVGRAPLGCLGPERCLAVRSPLPCAPLGADRHKVAMPTLLFSLQEDYGTGTRHRHIHASAPAIHPVFTSVVAAMATMFRNFSFEAASRRPAAHDPERAMSVSPFSPLPHIITSRPPTPPPTMGELAYQFNQHTLHVEVDPAYQLRPCYVDQPLTPPTDDFAFPELLDQPQQPAPYPRLSAAILRKQRQSHMQMQCSSSHLEDISSLVQRMIENGDQCRICDHRSRPSSNASTSDNDEGVDMEYNPPPPQEVPVSSLKFRRSGDRRNGAAVSKSVRMRIKSGITKRSSK